MRWRMHLLALAAAAVLIVAVTLGRSSAELQGQGTGLTRQVKQASPRLPIAQVVLYSSGVGYFQREGEIEGNARVDLSFPVNDINDLLKSLVLQDLGGGQINAVSYDSHDPIGKTLRSFAIDLTSNPSVAEILNQARGESVEASTLGGPAVSGVIVGIESQKQPVGKDQAIDIEVLNLLTADGLRSLPLPQVQKLKFLNATLDSEFRRALEVLSLSHDTQKKSVSFSFNGQGRRQVMVGYVVENPIWKTSYRLVIGKDGKPFLQGWAVVENTSDDDWNNVRVALISGRPISYQMDLYQPLYVPRPTVEPELFASLRPQAYGGNMEADKKLADAAPPESPSRGRALGRAPAPTAAPGMAGGGFGGGMPGAPGGPAGTEGAFRGARTERFGAVAAKAGEALGLDPTRGVASAATATEMGDYFQYVIDKPVSLPRQKSAMLPIVNQKVEGSKVSIYNQAAHARFPLLGFKFKNTTGLHLMQGPMTVLEGASYAGDARIMDLQPNEERLLSYAIDLGTEVEPAAKTEPQQLMSVKIIKGILEARNKLREARTYQIKNRSEHDRTVIIEHPIRPNWKLAEGLQPAERSREVYRFSVPVAAGKTARQEVVEELEQPTRIALSNLDDTTLAVYLKQSVVSDKVKEAMRRAIELKTKLAVTQREIASMQQQLEQLAEDQSRMRANIKELPPTAAAYKRYLEKFDQQETEIEKLQNQTKQLRASEDQQRKEFEAFVATLSVE